MQKIYKPQNGTYGYAPQAEDGLSGTSGNNVFYTIYKSNETQSIASTISTGQSLVPRVPANVSYKDNDLIITSDGSIYQIGNTETYPTIDRVGSIKIPASGSYEGDPSQENFNVEFEIVSNKYDAKNDYNYVEDCLSPLYHHRDSIDASVYGNYIHCTSGIRRTISGFDGSYMKLVLNFRSGMRFEKILVPEDFDQNIFIDNRYFLTYGHSESSPSPYDSLTITDYSSEKSQTTSIKLRKNLITSGTKSMTSGYVEYSYDGKIYRRKITITEQQ